MRGQLAVVLLVLLYSCKGQQFGEISPQEVGRLLSDRRYVQQQLDCVLGRGQCDIIGSQLKVAIPEVLLRNCRSCNAQQAENARNVINFIRLNYPNEWSQIHSRQQNLLLTDGCTDRIEWTS